MYIDKDKIKVTDKIIDIGGYARIHLCEYNGNYYAYKKFIEGEFKFTDNDIKRIEILSEKDSKPGIILPKFLVKNNNKFESYITDIFIGYTFEKLYKKDIKLKIELLLKTKDVLIKTNKDLGIIHGDIHQDNLMFNDDKKEIALIDFDNCKVDGINPNQKHLNPLYKTYMTYNTSDNLVDTYMFNVLTFSLLNDFRLFLAEDYLEINEINKFFTSKASLKLLEDLFYYTPNKEYLIDMIDEKSIQKILKS